MRGVKVTDEAEGSEVQSPGSRGFSLREEGTCHFSQTIGKEGLISNSMGSQVSE